MDNSERGLRNDLIRIDDKYGVRQDDSGRICKYTNPDVSIPDDEPLIVFRAQDKMSLPMLEQYAASCREAGSPPRFMASLYRRMADFADWQATNRLSVKVPD